MMLIEEEETDFYFKPKLPAEAGSVAEVSVAAVEVVAAVAEVVVAAAGAVAAGWAVGRPCLAGEAGIRFARPKAPLLRGVSTRCSSEPKYKACRTWRPARLSVSALLDRLNSRCKARRDSPRYRYTGCPGC